ncbi:MAG: DUF983 domain-containing protein [Litoreibacter sp.]|nr:DUF983 domain-containing protein [Litoreibacter sp.]
MEGYFAVSRVPWAVLLPGTIILSLWLLSRVKGALIAFQWAKRMHGFK